MKKGVVIFIGPPGAGKGALSRACVEKLSWKQLSTGNLFRKHMAEKTELGQEIAFTMKSGKLIDDGIVVRMVTGWLNDQQDHQGPVIFDGIPRTVAQADAFLKLMNERFSDLGLCILRLDLDDQVIIDRLSSRLVCSNRDCQAVFSSKNASQKPKVANVCDVCGADLFQREDDKVETVKKRLVTYHQHIDDLLNFYKQVNKNIFVVNANQPLDKVFKDVVSCVGERCDFN